MSSAPAPESLPEAPWKADFLANMKEMDSPEFVFSSLAPAPKGSPTEYLPRARYCIYRAMWAELPENKHNDAPMNDRVYESDMPCFTSDVRMNKVFELFASSAGKADDTSLTQGSGGGGPCEAVWWVKTDKTKVQWRIKGTAFVVGNDIEGEEESSGVRTVKTQLFSRMRVVKEEGKSGWSWAKELTGHFGNTPPGTRGTFKAPPPGQQVDKPYSKDLKPDQVKTLDDETARSNFRVVVIKPDEVEKLDLSSSDPSESRRFVYTFDEASGSWNKEECWP